MTQVTESDYREARSSQNPRTRQEFLDAIDLENAKEFVKGVRYDPDGKYYARFEFESSYGSFLPLFSKMRLRSDGMIAVGSSAFDELGFNFFVNALIHHEVITRDFMQNNM